MIDTRNVGSFIALVIKKSQYWPRHIPDQEIDNRTKKKCIGDVAHQHGKIYDYDYDIFHEGTIIYYEANIYIWWTYHE